MSEETTDRSTTLRRLLGERILVLDGAMGTSIQALDLTARDFGGPELEGCNEHLVLTRPDLVRDIHRRFLEAGADIVETDTFGATPLVLAEYGLEGKAHEINVAAARIARQAADGLATPERPRFVAGSMGPTTKTISVTGGITWDELADHYRAQAIGLIEGGVDVLLLETAQDTLNVKAGLIGIDRAQAELRSTVPLAVSGTVEVMGTLLAGQDVEAFYVALAHRDLLWIGLNCATGPDFMTDHLRTLAELSRFPVACVPNAGLPDEDGRYNETPEMIAAKLSHFAGERWVNLVGGCCGTVPEHIRLIADAMRVTAPRTPPDIRRTAVSGIETLVIDDDTRPVIVGERTNVLGSRKFKRLIAEGRIEEASEIGRLQVRRGAHVLDVCLQDPDRDETADMIAFLEMVTKKVKVPIMLDSTDHLVLEESLKLTQGKSIINSINLEDGEERFRKVVPLARAFGAALIVGCIDEDKKQAQAITRERKLAIAERSHALLTEKYGMREEDLIFDALVFPAGTGDESYIGSGVETIEGIRLIKERLPRCKTTLGISNVSFGLPAAGREVLNSVFLYHCVQAGLDSALVNSEKLERYAEIPEEERRLAEDLIWWRGDDPIAAFAAHFRDRKSKEVVEDWRSLPLDDRLARYVLVGSKDGLDDDLDEALRDRRPLAIINGPLMAGMDEVGRLFNNNELIVAEVLQSAEAMKAAVAHLEPHMEQNESAAKGTIVLATVKGDVHDIGKNLVEIILGNNGYRIVNLGIKVPPEELVRAYKKHEPDAIGLSGLLVKSAQMMVATVQDLKAAGIECPVLVGGAALTNKFTRTRIAPEYDGLALYATDAMNGLDLANQLQDPRRREALVAKIDQESSLFTSSAATSRATRAASTTFTKAVVSHEAAAASPPDLKLHELHDYDLDAILPYVNPVMLYTRHLGFKGRFTEALAAGDAKARELHDAVRAVEDEMIRCSEIGAHAVYKFFRAHSEDDDLVLLDAHGVRALERFEFGRQAKEGGLSLADFTAPREAGKPDYVCLFATTIGPGVRALAEEWKAGGEYLRSHILQVLALECAEGFAELLHQKIREMWGYADPPGMTKADLFKAKYRGVRVSFGYPACPRLEDQAKLFRLLDVERCIDVRLTEGFMMEPEGSVSALVYQHPEARYFSLTSEDTEALEQRLRV